MPCAGALLALPGPPGLQMDRRPWHTPTIGLSSAGIPSCPKGQCSLLPHSSLCLQRYLNSPARKGPWVHPCASHSYSYGIQPLQNIGRLLKVNSDANGCCILTEMANSEGNPRGWKWPFLPDKGETFPSPAAEANRKISHWSH